MSSGGRVHEGVEFDPGPRVLARAVTFDVGGTLIRPWPSVGHIYAGVAGRHGWPGLDPELLNRRFAAAWRTFEGFQHTREQWAALVDATFAGLIQRQPSETFFAELYEEFASAAAWQIYADVAPALEALAARGLKLGLISNWDERLRPLLGELGLERYFEVVVVSCEVGAAKPVPAIFEAAVGRLGLAPGAVVHVGDSFEADVQGARAAGLQARWLRREGTAGGAAGTIDSLRRLLEADATD